MRTPITIMTMLLVGAAGLDATAQPAPPGGGDGSGSGSGSGGDGTGGDGGASTGGDQGLLDGGTCTATGKDAVNACRTSRRTTPYQPREDKYLAGLKHTVPDRYYYVACVDGDPVPDCEADATTTWVKRDRLLAARSRCTRANHGLRAALEECVHEGILIKTGVELPASPTDLALREDRPAVITPDGTGEPGTNPCDGDVVEGQLTIGVGEWWEASVTGPNAQRTYQVGKTSTIYQLVGTQQMKYASGRFSSYHPIWLETFLRDSKWFVIVRNPTDAFVNDTFSHGVCIPNVADVWTDGYLNGPGTTSSIGTTPGLASVKTGAGGVLADSLRAVEFLAGPKSDDECEATQSAYAEHCEATLGEHRSVSSYRTAHSMGSIAHRVWGIPAHVHAGGVGGGSDWDVRNNCDPVPQIISLGIPFAFEAINGDGGGTVYPWCGKAITDDNGNVVQDQNGQPIILHTDCVNPPDHPSAPYAPIGVPHTKSCFVPVGSQVGDGGVCQRAWCDGPPQPLGHSAYTGRDTLFPGTFSNSEDARGMCPSYSEIFDAVAACTELDDWHDLLECIRGLRDGAGVGTRITDIFKDHYYGGKAGAIDYNGYRAAARLDNHGWPRGATRHNVYLENRCGDGRVNQPSEQCDGGPTCTADCKLLPGTPPPMTAVCVEAEL